ncbi:uncharacterized protein LOC112516723 [Cynara cardunculus var. scolymus]|uniref:DUF506 domain-containing protein n=1 Tax=Cynara cardunculus var. scolymus TaxID=59895 RepID=A0A118JUX1_CYNCS|nr:uncharacterized protein LOC112516723 [Cynara cardunculus var. scolymus]KVH93172.1 Protein of unknown function DUF506, plant [Cynara cardunculus var. scolymus]
MAKIPMRFKRITEAFDDDARARLCQSSGSEHSANSVTDLSDLVDSFFEGDAGGRGKSCGENKVRDRDQEETKYQEAESFYGTDSETKEMLIDLIDDDAENEDDRSKCAIRSEVETVCRNLENSSSEGFKRHLMTLLRQRGFDAGLCKSRWEKTGRHPAGEYEYIDVLNSGKRYIVEVSFGGHFTIARPTKTYKSLLEVIPNIAVIKPNKLKQVVRLMCAAMRTSLKTRDMEVSPWRKNGYMQTKWFGSYKRTTNALPTRSTAVSAYGNGEFNGRSFKNFECFPAAVDGKNDCRKEVERMHVVGNLKALMFSGM